jgi:hypothetical protein
MLEGPLADRLEYAILQIVVGSRDGSHHSSWGEWRNDVLRLLPDFSNDASFRVAFKRLWKRNYIRLSKADDGRYHGVEYSGNEQDDNLFFFIASFDATITDEGRSYWDGMRVGQP